MSPDRRLAWAAWVSIAAFIALWTARWSSFPLVLDPYYHLLIGEQVADAGGPIAYEWWEAAPGGRPHLYPPLLHLLIAGALKTGLAPVTVIRLFSVALPSLLIVTIYLVSRRLSGPRAGLAAAWTAMLPFVFHLHSAVTMAASLAMVLLLWLVAAVQEKRWRAAGLLFAMICYTHLGTPVVAAITLAAAAMAGIVRRQDAIKPAWGLALALPWYAHLAYHWGAFEFFPRKENLFLELPVGLYALAAVGAWAAWQGPRALRWPAALFAGYAPLAIHHQFRWLCGEGMMPVALLAGIGLAWAAWGTVPGSRRAPWAAAALAALLLLSPTVTRQEDGRWGLAWPDSAPWHLLNTPWVSRKTIDTSFVTPPIERLSALVAAKSQPGEIIWSNAPYVVGLVAALAHRPIASAMFSEVRAARGGDPVRAAHWLVWLKFNPFPGTMTVHDLERYPIELVAEDDVSILLRQTGAAERARAPQAAVPGWLAAGLVLLALAGVAADFARPDPVKTGRDNPVIMTSAL